MSTMSVPQPNVIPQVPSCIEIGLQASKKGNYQYARQMLQMALEQKSEQTHEQPLLIELMTEVADMYLSEGRHDTAKEWYLKALQRVELVHGINTLCAPNLMTRLAEICVLQEDMAEYERYFDNVQRAYLLCEEADVSPLLDSLIDLSWVLCIRCQLVQVQSVNNMIAQIRQLEEEKKLGLAVA